MIENRLPWKASWKQMSPLLCKGILNLFNLTFLSDLDTKIRLSMFHSFLTYNSDKCQTNKFDIILYALISQLIERNGYEAFCCRSFFTFSSHDPAQAFCIIIVSSESTWLINLTQVSIFRCLLDVLEFKNKQS